MLTKQRSVYSFGHVHGTPEHPTHARYSVWDDDTGQPVRSFELPMDDYLDLGKPEALTITIEPGDLLNA